MSHYEIVAIGISILSAIIAGLAALAARSTFKENRNLAYLQFHSIIAKHHSEEITGLRRIVRDKLESKAEEATKQEKTLAELDHEFHLKVSTLANYYESLGMFLEGSWHFLPKDVKNTMMAMLHNSVFEHWPPINKYKSLIHPNPPRDWAQSFQWLYSEVVKYREKNKL
jgi:hypothetical protein